MAADVVPKSQSDLQLYIPASASVTLTMVRIKPFLHLVSVSFSCTLYFFPVFNGAELLLKYHFKSGLHEGSCISTKHFKLLLEKAVAKTSG